MLSVINPERQLRKLKTYVANIAVNLCVHDLLQQWKTWINITIILETKHKIMNASERKFKRYFHEKPLLYIIKEQELCSFKGTNSPTFEMVNLKPVRFEQ